MSSMRIAPASSHSTTHSHLQSQSLGAPSAPGLHDTIRAGLGPILTSSTTPTPDSTHPLESRLKAWEATQETLKMTSLRRNFGLAEPVRRGMELKITREGEWRPAVLGGARPSVHEDILRGKDNEMSWEDVFTGEEMRRVPGVHEEMERKVRMQ